MTHDGVPEWADTWPMDWWWSTEFATAVTGTQLHLHFHAWGYKKNMANEHKVNRREKLHHRIFDAARCMSDPDALCKAQISWISNTRRSVTIERWTYVCKTFLTGNDLRNKILKYWHNVTGHPAYFSCLLLGTVFSERKHFYDKVKILDHQVILDYLGHIQWWTKFTLRLRNINYCSRTLMLCNTWSSQCAHEGKSVRMDNDCNHVLLQYQQHWPWPWKNLYIIWKILIGFWNYTWISLVASCCCSPSM
jgi:hypothetical protein